MTELKTTCIMLTVEQWERLRDEAHETRRSQSEIVREALEMRWEQEKEEKNMKIKKITNPNCLNVRGSHTSNDIKDIEF